MSKWESYFDFVNHGSMPIFLRVPIGCILLCWYSVCFIIKIVCAIFTFIGYIAMSLSGVWVSIFGFATICMTILQLAGQGVTLWKTDPLWFIPLEAVCILIAVFFPYVASMIATLIVSSIGEWLERINIWVLDKLSNF